MAPNRPLPLPEEWPDAETYIDSLLSFSTSSDIFRNLCGGVHILDFLTREPDLYATVLSREWREWFEEREVEDVLDLLLREDIQPLLLVDVKANGAHNPEVWRGGRPPPLSLLEYIQNVRRHCLQRDISMQPPEFQAPANSSTGTIPRHIAVGMKPKKVHEVENFARYVNKLSADIAHETGEEISHIVDLGSGQNYLGRTLASSPYNKHVVAIERKHHNIDGAKDMDVLAKLTKKEKIMRNKKEYKKQKMAQPNVALQMGQHQNDAPASEPIVRVQDCKEDSNTSAMSANSSNGAEGSIKYVEREIQDGCLEPIISHLFTPPFLNSKGLCTNGNLDSNLVEDHASTALSHTNPFSETLSCFNDAKPNPQPKLMVVSLHSCGNLLHHSIRSLVLNPSVVAVALVGCCYNLMTERLGPATYKLPILRPQHPRLESTSNACDPHGFPMSKGLETFPHQLGNGVRLNITARMMAVQAPYNWGPDDSQAFFTRHFFRALLQRIFLDRGVVDKPGEPDSLVGGSPAGTNVPGTQLIVGSLRKFCFTSFRAYVRGAITKLIHDSNHGDLVQERTASLSDEEIDRYEENYKDAKKKLSIVWSLMAFSAGVVESLIVVDRWLFLYEQDQVQDCWVEPVFDYKQSPRNLAVTGVKRRR